MTRITYIQPDGVAVELDIDDTTSVMRAAVTGGVRGIVGECGGQAMCATCHVYVTEPHGQLPEIGEDESEMLECTAAARTERSRLSCQLVDLDLDELTVEIPATQL